MNKDLLHKMAKAIWGARFNSDFGDSEAEAALKAIEDAGYVVISKERFQEELDDAFEAGADTCAPEPYGGGCDD